MKYIYAIYLSSGISSAMITAITHALFGTGIIVGAIMIRRVFMISREIKELPSNGLSDEQWNASVDRVIRHHQIKHAVPLIAMTYVALLLVNYFIIMR
ncbi:hypothetical protein SAMN02746066_04340 [Anaerosporobacter mobilis DSM 15930]|uniref:Uncharacterized protein n=1 Tax=Anaerosporobacter mobilis DSM 15930 TaxID=1120996 RepID=A0A1M7NAI3_9FIRM|nr:hypothetical protein [Anaerosporobacter mobilis]SHN00600.1 hypothetical protein SAMN02746066_04340 [Anaerosporobacter mobilis DSM 15930]